MVTAVVPRGRLSENGLAWSASYDGTPASTGAARRLTASFFAHAAEAGFAVGERIVQSVQLVVSELVTNAVKYAPGPCRLKLELDRDRTRVTVWDTGPALPVVHRPDVRRVGGHGLEIVTAVCQFLHVERAADGRGKCLRAQIALG